MNIKWDTPTQFVYTNIDTHLQTDTAISKVMESRDIETRHHSNDITFSFFVFHFKYVFLFLVLILIFIVYFFFLLCVGLPPTLLGQLVSFQQMICIRVCLISFFVCWPLAPDNQGYADISIASPFHSSRHSQSNNNNQKKKKTLKQTK